MPGPYVLLQFGADAHNTKFEDLEGRPAFTVSVFLPSFFTHFLAYRCR